MTGRLLTILKVLVVVLIVVAIGMGVWFLYTNVIRKDENGTDYGVQRVELEWWILWEQESDVQVLIDAYQAQNPNVTIKVTKQDIQEGYKEKVKTQLSDNSPLTGPDIVRIHHTWVPFLENNLSPLPTSTMTTDEYKATFYDTAYEDLQGSNGNMYAIPIMYDGIGVYYNKTLLKNAGYTTPEENWDEFVIQAKNLTRYDAEGRIEIAGAGIGSENNIDFAFDIASLLMLQELQDGLPMVDPSGKTTFGDDPEMRVAKALKYYTDFVTVHKVWDRSLDRDIQMFAEGRLAMMFAPSWRVHDINDALEGVGATLDYDIAPVPQQPSATGLTFNWSEYWAEGVSAESENKAIAWDFLNFITQPEQLRTFYKKTQESREFGEIYPRKDMKEEIIGDQYVGAYVKMADSSKSWRMVDKEKVSSEFKDLIKTIILNGGMSNQNIQNRLKDTAAIVDQIIAGI